MRPTLERPVKQAQGAYIFFFNRQAAGTAGAYDPGALFRAFTWITCISILTILALATVAVYQITSREVTRDAADTATRISALVFDYHRSTLTKKQTSGNWALQLDRADFSAVDSYFRTRLRDFDILKVKIYTPDGKILYSTDRKIIGKQDSNNERLLKALSGRTDSHLEKKDQMLDLAEESQFNVSVVETYIPIRAGTAVIGAFELYSDVSGYNRKIIHVVKKTVVQLSLILLAVFGSSYILVTRLINELKRTRRELTDKVIQLEAAVSNVRQLEGIIPICSYCKKIRADEESWQQIENYISSHTDAKFSHGICPDCFSREHAKMQV